MLTFFSVLLSRLSFTLLQLAYLIDIIILSPSLNTPLVYKNQNLFSFIFIGVPKNS